jgi:hypothetical protein
MANIRLSSEGLWYHDGVEVTHERTVDLFFKSLTFHEDQYYLTGEKDPVLVDVEDTAYFIRGLDKNHHGYVVTVSDGTSEPLALSSLDTGAENQLYCRIHGKTHRAKFARKVYYELMRGLAEREGYYGLNVDGIFYPIQEKIVKVNEKKATPVKTKTKKAIKKSVKKNVSPTRKKSQSKKSKKRR